MDVNYHIGTYNTGHIGETVPFCEVGGTAGEAAMLMPCNGRFEGGVFPSTQTVIGAVGTILFFVISHH